MTLTDADVQVILDSIKTMLEKHRKGPYEVAAVYYPSEKTEFIAVLQFDEKMVIH